MHLCSHTQWYRIGPGWDRQFSANNHDVIEFVLGNKTAKQTLSLSNREHSTTKCIFQCAMGHKGTYSCYSIAVGWSIVTLIFFFLIFNFTCFRCHSVTTKVKGEHLFSFFYSVFAGWVCFRPWNKAIDPWIFKQKEIFFRLSFVSSMFCCRAVIIIASHFRYQCMNFLSKDH